ncbi:Bicarbonate transport system permease protein CmpB [Corynebacterium hansenii]|nr:Bicarbonate transport system permease protein CmpB [Corynebacterium hansenii]
MSDAITVTDRRTSPSGSSSRAGEQGAGSSRGGTVLDGTVLDDGPASPASGAQGAGSAAAAGGGGASGAAEASSRNLPSARTALADAARSPILRGAAVFLACMAVIVGLWQAAIAAGLLTGLAPGPADVWARGTEILSDPFYRDGPSSVGIFWHLAASLRRVLLGFAIAAAVAIPIGFVLGMITPLRWGLEPLVQVLRPVSPLAWLPIGLALLRDSENTALFVIIMSALWPMLLQTIAGVMGIDPLYRDLARTLGTNRRDTFRHILLPATLPSIVTGMRLSLSTAWLVIIAAEMLVGGRGMGYFVWNMWNRLDIAAIVVAIVVIGAAGFVLDQIVSNIQKVVPSA